MRDARDWQRLLPEVGLLLLPAAALAPTAVPAATPCGPAPVSAMIRFLPARFARRHGPGVLFSL